MVVFYASGGHLVLSHLGFAIALYANTFPTFIMLLMTLHLERQTVFSRFYGYHIKTVLSSKDMVNTLYLLFRFFCIKIDLNFYYYSYLQTVIANVNNRSLHCTYLRIVMYLYVYVTLYVNVTCLIEI